jgi:mannosyltransferase OCH1-like enzyme
MAAVSASPHSLLAYLTPAELRQGVSARNISFFRPATVPATGLEEQLVPRVIMQTGSTWDRALRKNAQYIHSWLDLNPEYEYNFFSDEHARRFVQLHGNAGEKDAYRRILTGSQRGDVFRVLDLRIAGGVYADLDEEQVVISTTSLVSIVKANFDEEQDDQVGLFMRHSGVRMAIPSTYPVAGSS